MATHRAIATTAKGQVDEIRVPTEKPGPDEILVKTSYASLSWGDIYIIDQGLWVPEYPLPIGFSGSGEVVEVGSGVKDLKVGDKVVTRPLPS